MLGLNKFRDHLGGFEGSYTIIGGAACHTHFSELNQSFRATKDIDLVLRVDTVDREFAVALHSFLDAGGYSARQRGGEGAREYYRFHKPTNAGYPAMLELFVRNSAVADTIEEGQEIARIDVEDDLISLSAIILDDDYFDVLHQHTETMNGISVLSIAMLIVFKARAFLDLQRRQDEGDAKVKTDDIKKHRNDVFRLLTIVVPGDPIKVPSPVWIDVGNYAKAIVDLGASFKPSDFGVQISIEEGLEILRSLYLYEEIIVDTTVEDNSAFTRIFT